VLIVTEKELTKGFLFKEKEMAEFKYYRRNVPYVVGGRWTPTDTTGWTMTNENPFIAVPTDRVRDFKMANKRAIVQSLIIEAEEPTTDWEMDNAISDTEAVELVKGNFLTLKKRVEKVDSVPILHKLVEAAKENDRPKKTITLIEARLAEVEDDVETPLNMRGVTND
jgi:hypothetical protein